MGESSAYKSSWRASSSIFCLGGLETCSTIILKDEHQRRAALPFHPEGLSPPSGYVSTYETQTHELLVHGPAPLCDLLPFSPALHSGDEAI